MKHFRILNHWKYKMEQKLLTVKEAAILLRISASKLCQLVRADEVPHVCLGGRVVIPEKHLSVWIERTVKGG